MTAVLDSWAVLAWLQGEQPAAGAVDRLVLRKPVMSWINAVEVLYRIERADDRAAADEIQRFLEATFELDPASPDRCVAVARLKAERAIAVGDCFGIATAAAYGLPFLTGDPEIIDADGLPCRVEDLRA